MIRCLAIAFICLALPASGAARPESPPETEPASARPLTLEEALRLAEQHNPALREAAAAARGAEAGVDTARGYPNPTLTVGAFGHQQARMPTAAVPGPLHGVNVSQPLELPGVRSTRIRAARERSEAGQHRVAGVRLAVRGAVKQAFYEALRRRREIELAQGTLELLEDLRRRIQVQVEVGEAGRLELRRAEAEAASARIAVRSAEVRLSAALAALHAAIGMPLEGAEPRGTLETSVALPPLEMLETELLARHPALAVAEADLRQARANVASERAQRLPQPSVWFDWFQQPEAAQVRYGVSLPLPLWNRRRGPIAEAEAARAEAEARASGRRVELLSALERAYSLFQLANQQVQIAETSTVPQATAAVEAAEAAFTLGERGILDLLDARRVLRAAQVDHLTAQFDRQQALIELEQLRALDVETPAETKTETETETTR